VTHFTMTISCNQDDRAVLGASDRRG